MRKIKLSISYLIYMSAHGFISLSIFFSMSIVFDVRDKTNLNAVPLRCVFQVKMYKARTIFTTLAPLAPRICGPEKYISWMVRNQHSSSRITQAVFTNHTRKYNSRVATEPFLNGSTSSYVEEMYNAWLQDPHSVHVVSKF